MVIFDIFKPGKKAILIILVLSSFRMLAAEYYWVGGSGSWSDISHWATASGGGSMYFTVPTASDNVYFDKYSFTSKGQTVNVNTSAVCKNLSWSGARYIPGFSCISSFSLRIYGSLTLIPDMIVAFSGNVYFESTNPGKTITSAGNTFNSNIYLQGIGGSWILQDNFSTTGVFKFVNGIFNTNNKNINCGTFNSEDTNIRTLTIANSTLKINDWKLNGTNLTFNTSKSFINAAKSFSHLGVAKSYCNVAAKTMTAGGSDFKVISGPSGLIASGILNVDTVRSSATLDLSASYVNVVRANGFTILKNCISIQKAILDSSVSLNNISQIGSISVGNTATINSNMIISKAIIGGNGIINSDNSFDTLILTAGKKYIFGKNTTQTIKNNLAITGKCNGYITLQSALAGTNAIISKSSGTVSGHYLLMKDIKVTGGASFFVDNYIDQGNNSGWTVNTLSQNDLYWVGGTGNWSDLNHWSTTSGGIGGSCMPNQYSNVHFDANSFTAMGQSVTIDTSNAYCRNLTWTSALYNPIFKCALGRNLHIFGSSTLISAMTLSFLGDIYFDAPTTGKTISSACNAIDGNIYFEGIGGGWTLSDILNVKKSIYFDKGSLNTNKFNVICKLFSSKDTGLRTLTIARSTIFTNKWDVNGTNLTLNAANSLITDVTEFSHINAAKTYNNIASKNTPLILKGGKSKFNLITVTNGSLTLSNDNIIDSLVVFGNLIATDNDTINYLYVKVTAQLGTPSSVYRQVINKVVFDSNGAIYGNNKIKYLRIDNTGLIQGNNTIGNASLYGDASINDNNSFDTLSLYTGNIYKLQYNKTQTITKKLNLNGRCSSYITITSSIIGNNAIISKLTGNVTGSYLIIRDVAATGGAVFSANNSIGMGNYPGWTINSASASNLYWVGGSGNWSDSSHWALVSGGSGYNCMPGPFDNVFFDSKSFSAAGQTVKIDISNVNCNNINWTGALFNPTFNLPIGKAIHIFGSLTFIPIMNLAFNGIAYFETTTAGKTITSAGKKFNSDIAFTGIGGEWILLDSLTVGNSLYVSNGKVNCNTNKVSCSTFYSYYSSLRNINISNSVITAKSWNVYGINLTLNTTNSHIKGLTSFNHTYNPLPYNNITSSGSLFSMNGGDSKFNLVTVTKGSIKLVGNNTIDSLIVNGNTDLSNNNTINYLYTKGAALFGTAITTYRQFIQKAVIDSSASIFGNNKVKFLSIGKLAVIQGIDTFGNVVLKADATINGDNIFDSLTLAAGKTYILQDARTQTINNEINIIGSNCLATTIRSSTNGSLAAISKTTGTISLNFVELKDIKAMGGAVFTANNSIDAGNNNGWSSITTISPSNLYWVGGSGNWSDPSHWSTTSGGAGNACIPGSFNNVFFDANSFSAAGQTVNMDLKNANCNSMDWSSATFNPVFIVPSGKTFHMYGSLTLITNMNFSFYGVAYFDATSVGKTIKLAGKAFYTDVHFTGLGGEWKLLDSFAALNTINFVNGKLNTNSNYLSSYYFNSMGSNNRELNISNSEISIKTWRINGINFTLTAANSHIKDLISFSHLYSPAEYYNISSPSGSFVMIGGDSKFNFVNVSQGNLSMQGNNYINSLKVSGTAVISNNNTINSLYVKGAALIGRSTLTDKQIIQKAVIESTAVIYGDNNIKYLNISGVTFLQGNDTFGKVNLSADATIIGNNVYDTLTLSSGKTYLLQDGNTQSINKQLNISGNNCFPTSIRSRTVGSYATIFKDSGIVSADFIELRDIKACGGATFFAGGHSSNLGNSQGWDFSTSPDYIYGLGKDTVICYGEYLRINNANGAKTFNWQDGSSKPYFKVTQPGIFWLTASFGQGCTYADTIVVLKVNQKPKADFMVNDSLQCVARNSFAFTDKSIIDSGLIARYNWDFGDGESDSIQNPTHIFNMADTFSLLLVVESALGCKDTARKQMFVFNPPKAGFKTNDSLQCLNGNNFKFTNLYVSNTPCNYVWDFGDGVQSTLTHSNHIYSNPMKYDVTLIANGPMGCSDTFSSSVLVNIMPKADFNVSSICLNEVVNFTNSSTIDNPDSITLYKWDFGNGSSSSDQNPAYTFLYPGNFAIHLTVVSNYGCRDSINKSVYIRPHITAPSLDRVSIKNNTSDIEIEWSTPTTGNTFYYVLEKSTDNNTFVTLSYPDRFNNKYIDSSVMPDSMSYYYRIKAIDSCSYNSEYSNVGKSILLHVTNKRHIGEITWSAYGEWPEGVNRYEIEVFNKESSEYELVGTVDGNTLEYNDDITNLYQPDYYYRVAAVRNGDEIKSYSNSDSVTVTFGCFIPNAFTPNGDGLNDKFKAVGASVLDFNLAVFDRWGSKMFETNDINIGWDGTYKGELVPEGYYYYQLTVRGVRGKRVVKNGTVLLTGK